MKRVIIGLTVLALMGCEKENNGYTTVEVSAIDAATGYGMDSIEFHVYPNNDEYQWLDVKYTNHGHCRLSFETSRHYSYYLSFAGDYQLANNNFMYPLNNGESNTIEAILAKSGDLQIDIENVNQTSNKLQYRISPLNPAHDIVPSRQAYWGNYNGIETNSFISSYTIYEDMPAVDYLVETRWANGWDIFYDTITVKPDTLNVHTIQY